MPDDVTATRHALHDRFAVNIAVLPASIVLDP